MVGGAMFRMDIGVVLWIGLKSDLKPLSRIHVLLAYQIIVCAAHVGLLVLVSGMFLGCGLLEALGRGPNSPHK